MYPFGEVCIGLDIVAELVLGGFVVVMIDDDFVASRVCDLARDGVRNAFLYGMTRTPTAFWQSADTR
jgi:hypothetical protein